VTLTGPFAGGEREFDAPIVIGRADSDVEVIDPHVSRRHARLTPLEEGVQIADLGSANGTWIDGRRLLDPEVLTEPTLMRIGKTRFEVLPGSQT
jgi:pSer/pThr/pTyr-binding forkhead associated (FHA) protein